MLTIKSKNRLYTIKYDGDILYYKSTLVARPILSLFGFQSQFEFPLNILLHYKSRSALGIKSLRFCINQYASNQKTLKPRSLKRIMLLEGHKSRQLLASLDQIVTGNMSGQTNMALAHINQEELQRFYSGIMLNYKKTGTPPAKTGHTNDRVMPRPMPQAG